MALRRPLQELEGISTLREAQNFYRRMGQYLSGTAPKGGPTSHAYMDKGWRDEAKEARRLLEARFGDTVRLTSSVARAPEEVGGPRSMPTWSMRAYFTVTKPEKSKISAPYLLYVPLDPETLEPLGVFYNTPAHPTGLVDALRVAATRRATRRST